MTRPGHDRYQCRLQRTEERVPRALTWLPTKTLSKIADVGGGTAMSVKVVPG